MKFKACYTVRISTHTDKNDIHTDKISLPFLTFIQDLEVHLSFKYDILQFDPLDFL